MASSLYLSKSLYIYTCVIASKRFVTVKKQEQTNIKISKDWTLVDDALPPDSNTGKVIRGPMTPMSPIILRLKCLWWEFQLISWRFAKQMHAHYGKSWYICLKDSPPNIRSGLSVQIDHQHVSGKGVNANILLGSNGIVGINKACGCYNTQGWQSNWREAWRSENQTN